jgi:uncharacterized protein
MMDLPEFAAWRLEGAHEGFEVLYPRREEDGYRFDGHSVGVEEGVPWAIRYTLDLDAGWITRGAHVVGRSRSGVSEVGIEADGSGGWRVNGEPAHELDGCLDVDLEGSSLTNAFPVHRLALDVGESVESAATYVRVLDLSVGRLEQRYARLEDEGGRTRYDYESPAFGFRCVLAYDHNGFVTDYPGIAVRVA